MVLWLFTIWCLLVLSTNVYNPVTMASAIIASRLRVSPIEP